MTQMTFHNWSLVRRPALNQCMGSSALYAHCMVFISFLFCTMHRAHTQLEPMQCFSAGRRTRL